MSSKRYTNRLINEISPYLLQHAHNPVNWLPWDQEALEKAKKENKPLLISIGYSSCHWCHVMESESFEDEGIAQIMNDNFICIKVDREERPDIDNLYMDTVQMLTGQGGWPLNCFALPDGRPFYGGTYFPKSNWKEILLGITRIYHEEGEKVLEQADLIAGELVNKNQLISFTNATVLPEIDKSFESLSDQFDEQNGGIGTAPKFPMPAIYEFLLTYNYFTGDKKALHHVLLTLDKITEGGIYDQIGGGFARYSTDENWFAPHFEKMLYDNAQLISLLSHAYLITQNRRYKEIIQQTVEFLGREMIGPEGGFYSALDADSEGKEGKFYVWQYRELENILSKDASLICDYYGVRKEGNWEPQLNILSVNLQPEKLSLKYGIDEKKVLEILNRSRQKLLNARDMKIRPDLDSKIIASWNGLMIQALVEAFKATQTEHYLEMALNNGDFIVQNMLEGDRLLRLFPKKRKIHGFLDDYAAVIAAFMALYGQSADMKWLNLAENLINYTLKHFFDPISRFFFYESDHEPTLISRKIETSDNVIPSGNSLMAMNLLFASSFFGKSQYKEMVTDMLKLLSANIIQYPAYYANWLRISLLAEHDSEELVITGKDARKYLRRMAAHFRPELVLAGTEETSDNVLFKNRFAENKTMFYVCRNNTCLNPVENVEEAIKLLDSRF